MGDREKSLNRGSILKRDRRQFLMDARSHRWCQFCNVFFSYELVDCIQYFDAIFLSILLLPSLELQCLLFTVASEKAAYYQPGKKSPGFVSYETRQKICFLFKWQLSMTMPTLVFDAYTKAWVLRGILLLISKKIEDNHL